MSHKLNLTGIVFGKLSVIRECGVQSGSTLWECNCVCGTKVFATSKRLNSGRASKCKECSKKDRIKRPAANKKDLTGQKFHRLRVLCETEQRVSASGRKRTQYICICDCGTQVTLCGSSLTSGNSKSCGCMAREILRERITRHGLTNTRVHQIWIAMLKRCQSSNTIGYKNYGGRGISVCDRWLVFENFFLDMGHPPASYSIERINNDGNYEPENCRWATRKQQARNRRSNRIITFDGESLCLVDWAKKLGIHSSALRLRLDKWPLDIALTKPKIERRTKCLTSAIS